MQNSRDTMKAVILKAKQGSSFHFGEYAPFGETFLDYASSFPHSDTIFSALVNIHDFIWPEETNYFVNFFKTGSIRISSGMFCIKTENETLFFLPRPVMMKTDPGEDPKRFRNIEWISTGAWQNGMVSQPGGDDLIIVGKRFVCQKEEWTRLTDADPAHFRIYEEEALPRVMVHSETREDTLYQQTNTVLCGSDNLNVSYYFLADYENLENLWRERLETVISLLPDSGLGGQRTTGCGFFEGLEWKENPLPETAEDSYRVNLGLLSPEKDLSDCLAYRIITRGGRYTGKGRLKKVIMLREGAIVNGNIEGSMADISPAGDGSSLRLGMPVFYPVPKHLINL